MQAIREHLEAIGRPARNICFVEAKYAGSGIDEQEDLARYFHDQYGLKVMHADPRELTLAGDEVIYGGDVVDLVYRDYAVADLLLLGRHGRRCAADAVAAQAKPRDLVDRRRARPKELLGGADRSENHRAVFQRRRAAGFSPAHPVDADRLRPQDHDARRPRAATCSILPAASEKRWSSSRTEPMAAKACSSASGTRRPQWDAAIDAALADPNRWVVQQLASIPVSEFPVVGPDGRVHIEPFHVVMGFAPTQYGVAILGRASQKQVVNVAQRGGMCVVFIGRHGGRLHGPAQPVPEN